MFRDMRRKKQQLSEPETVRILKSCTSGVLAVSGDDGYPYAVPLSYAYADGKLYFHLAGEGHKADSIARSEKVSFCVIDQDEIVQESFTTYFRSVIAFGRARFVTDEAGKRRALSYLAQKYAPDFSVKGQTEIESGLSKVCILEVTIEHVTGKEAIELVKRKEG